MFTSLPDFTPRDSHSLWYTSSRSPFLPATSLDNLQTDATNNQSTHHSRRSHVIDRTPLARLALDEQYTYRRKLNVQNFGSGWLRPPGIPKTLHQIREEKREQEEHQEALRREQLAQELAEAEAGGMQPEDGMMDDVQLDGAQDLDDEIPDADDEYGIGDDSDDDEDENEEDDDEDENEEPDSEDEADEEAVREERQNDLMASRLRMTEDAFREALIRGNADGDDMYGDDEELEEGERSNMLDEDDFGAGMGDDMGLDMDANLDDDIPEAEDGGYEHTDSEADLTSSEEEEQDDDDDEIDEHDISFAPRAAPLGPPLSPTIRSRTSMSGPRNSMDLSTFLSQDESSFMASSPAQGRRARQ